MADPAVSLVVPLYNEEGCLAELHRRLVAVMEKSGRSYEIIFINDGSQDNTRQLLGELFAADPNLVVIDLRRNYGQTAALAAGFDQARGETIISMDGDLQHLPEEIPLFLEKIDQGYDLVSGWRKKRIDNFILRRLPSLIANKMIKWISGMKLHDFGTTFKAYTRHIVKNLQLYGELHRFIPALTTKMGVKLIEIPITNVERKTGQSNYGLSRVRKVMLDLITVKFITSFIDRPLQLFGFIGLCLFAAGFAIGGIISIGFFFFELVIAENLGNLILAVTLIIVGALFICIGLLAEILARIYFRVHDQKPYFIKQVLEHRPAKECE